MIITVKQQTFKWKYQYEVAIKNENIIFTAEANRVILPKLRSIVLKEQRDTVAVLKQTNFLKKLLSFIPIISISCPFEIEENKIFMGFIDVGHKLSEGNARASYRGKEYKIFSHSCGKNGVKYSVVRENIQVGLIVHDNWKRWESDSYYAEFNCDTNYIFNILIILFIDIMWYTNDIDLNTEAWSYEWNINIIGEKKLDSDWTSDNKNF